MKENKWRFGHVTHRSEQQRVGGGGTSIFAVRVYVGHL